MATQAKAKRSCTPHPRRTKSRSKTSARRPHCPNSPPAGPSRGLLALIAGIASSSSSVDGRPLSAETTTLPFLYPHGFRDDHPDFCATDDEIAESSSAPTPCRRQPAKRSTRSALSPEQELEVIVADRYEQGDDGRWRKVTEWSLYGSTVRRNSRATAVDDTSSSTSTSSAPSASSMHTTTDDSDSMDDSMDFPSLPAGWKTSKNANDHPTALIIGLSVIIAALIILIMLWSIFAQKRKRKRKDPEKRMRQKAGGVEEASDDEDAGDAQVVKAKKRGWARATARWKANARWCARRRRAGKRFASKGADTPNYGSCNDGAPSRIPTRPSSPSPSLDRTDSGPAVDQESPSSPQTHSGLPDVQPPSPSPPPTLPALPPAYHPNTSSRPASPPPEPETPLPPLSPCPDERPPYAGPSKTAHVAIDDKTLLERIANMASAPPVEECPLPGSSSAPGPSVPEWQDEDPADFPPSPSTRESARSPSLLFPPPPPAPSKGKMAVYEDVDYEYAEVETELEPSAPPFDAHPDPAVSVPSAPPPADDYDSDASAPPIEYEMEGSSAPPLNEDEPPAASAPPPPPSAWDMEERETRDRPRSGVMRQVRHSMLGDDIEDLGCGHECETSLPRYRP